MKSSLHSILVFFLATVSFCQSIHSAAPEDTSLVEGFLNAVCDTEDESLQQLEECINKGVDVNHFFKGLGFTALHIAAESGSHHKVLKLLECQADPNILATDETSMTPLMCALGELVLGLDDDNFYASACHLLDFGANTDSLSLELRAAFLTSILLRNDRKRAQQLVARGVHEDTKFAEEFMAQVLGWLEARGESDSPSHEVCEDGEGEMDALVHGFKEGCTISDQDFEKLKEDLQAVGIEVDSLTDRIKYRFREKIVNCYPFQACIFIKNAPLLNRVLKCMKSNSTHIIDEQVCGMVLPKLRNFSYGTALHVATALGSIECVKILIINGADVNAVTTVNPGRAKKIKVGFTALHIASIKETKKHKAVKELLLAKGAVKSRVSRVW